MKIQLTPEQQKRADALAKMSPSEWDAVCKQCGICCLDKFEYTFDDSLGGRKTIYLKQCCEKFDTKTCKCSIYKDRLKRKDCAKVNMDIILSGKLLPSSCGYVEYIFGPAPFPANVDFSQVHPIDNNKSEEQFEKDIIYESVLWNEYGR